MSTNNSKESIVSFLKRYFITDVTVVTEMSEVANKTDATNKGKLKFEHINRNSQYNCIILLCNKISLSLIRKTIIEKNISVEDFTMFKNFKLVRSYNETNIAMFQYETKEGFKPGQIARILIWETQPT